MLIGGGALVYKLSKQDAQKIEEHTGIPPDELDDEDLQAAMQELNIQSQNLTDEDRAAMAQDQAANPDPEETVAPAAAPAAAAGGQEDYIEQLKQLAALRDAGILSDEEFEAKKKQLLGL